MMLDTDDELGDPTGEMPNVNTIFAVNVMYNGLTKSLGVRVSELVRDILQRAIPLFGALPNPHTLSMFTADKGELADSWTVKEAGLSPGEDVLLRPSTVKAG